MEQAGKPRVGIIGAGALGGYFGIRLACSGVAVRFLLRSDYAAARTHGLELTLADGTVLRVEQPDAVQSTAEMGRVDWAIIGLKTTLNHRLAELLPPVVGPDTVLITIQNGLGNIEVLNGLFPRNPVIGALCQIGVNRTGPGRVRSFVPGDGFVQIGAGPNATAAQVEACRAVFEAAGIRTRVAAALGEAIWRKLMWNVPFNGLTVAIGGRGTDAVCADPALRAVARALMEEIRAAAAALGYAIEPEFECCGGKFFGLNRTASRISTGMYVKVDQHRRYHI